MSRSLPFRRSQPRSTLRAGFSVLEMLVVVTVAGIAMVVAIPSLLNQLAKQRHVAAAETVANLMQQTRLRAIRDNRTYAVQVVGGKVTGRGVLDSGLSGGNEVEIELEQANLAFDTTADCLKWGNASPGVGIDTTLYGAPSVSYQPNGIASAPGAICVTDGGGNLLQVGVDSPNAPPRVRKWLPGVHAPGGFEGFYERTSAAFGDRNVWVWF